MLRKRNVLFVSILIFIFIAIATAAIFEDNDSSDFSQGSFYRTFYNTSNSVHFLQLNISQGFNSGNYSSRIFDSGINFTWNNISWTSELCYGCELIGNSLIETGNFVRPLNMSGNILLLHMNELSGNITDYSPYNITGKVALFEGTEYGAIGRFNTSIDFENGIGSNGEYINFSTPAPMNSLSNQITLESWIMAESFPSDPTIIDKGTSLLSFFVSSGASNLLTFILDTSSGSATTYTANTDMDTGQWYHVVATYNGSQVRLYLNGELDNTPVARTGTVSTNSLDLVVGSGWSGSNPNAFPFDGLIDELAIYNRSLSAQEIQDRYARGALRLNLSVRSCNDSSCVGESFNKINGISPQNLNLISNRYFQYKFDFNTENTTITPKLYNVTTSYVVTNAPPTINLTYPFNNTNYASCPSSSIRQSYLAQLQTIDEIKIRRGESESIELPVKNNGLRFLNNCLFTKSAGVSEWISGQDIYSLSPGQTINYIFSVNVPIDAEVGDYFVTLGVSCQEVNSSFTYQISVLGGEFELNILESERVGTKLRVSYAIENFGESEKELNVNYKLIDSDSQIVSEGLFDSARLLTRERKEFEGEFELPRNSLGEYTLIMEVSDNLDTVQKQQDVRLTTGGISGFAISDNNLRTIAWFGIVVLLSFGISIVIKVIRNQLAVRRANQEMQRQFITIDLN